MSPAEESVSSDRGPASLLLSNAATLGCLRQPSTTRKCHSSEPLGSISQVQRLEPLLQVVHLLGRRKGGGGKEKEKKRKEKRHLAKIGSIPTVLAEQDSGGRSSMEEVGALQLLHRVS